jgi:predicted Zn-dependent peptidase
MNRTIAPDINPINSFSISKANKTVLSNDIPFYYFNSGYGELIKIEWMFEAGNWYQSSPLIAFSANNALVEGTGKYTSHKILNAIEYYGASLGYSVDKDNAFISVIVMRKYLTQVLPLMEELIKNAIFPEKELEIFKQKHKQQFLIEQNKVSSLARTHFAKMVFGNQHPYGYLIQETDFDKISRPELTDFYKKYYHSGNCKIVASGKVEPSDINAIADFFGKNNWRSNYKASAPVYTLQNHDGQKLFVEMPNAVQNAIRIGKVFFNKTHENYGAFSVLNCVIGGYFGSRLMKKIREEKGYTYGINSLFISLVKSGFWAIITEVGSDVTKNALDCIYEEVEKLSYENISDEELSRVKNYMTGEMVRMFDGPFAQAENLISLLEYDLDYNHYTELLETIKDVTPEKIREIAGKYLNPSTFNEVVVGKSF